MSSFLTKENLEPEIRRVEDDNGLTIKEIKFSKPDLAGAHFATGVETAKVTVESKEKGNRIIHLFIKRPAQSEAHKTMISGLSIFQREADAYNVLLPEMINFSKSKGVDLKSCVPVCYAAFGSGEKESIILEDLMVQGYKMFPYNSLKLQDVDHVTLALEAMAKVHAVSYAMKESVNFLEKFSCLEEIFFNDKPDCFMILMMKPLFQPFITLFDDENSKIRKNMEKFYDIGFQHISKALALTEEKFAVVNHGDFWSNNMIFKYGENGKPISVKLVDWQVTRFNSVGLEICYYIYTSTTSEFRKDHLNEVLKIYYKEFTETMKKLGAQIPFTYGELYEEYMSHRMIGLMFIPGLLSVGLQTKGDHSDPDDVKGTDISDGFAAASKKQMDDPKKREIMKRIITEVHDEVEDLLNEL